MSRKLFADLPSTDEVVPVSGRGAAGSRKEELWPVGTLVNRVEDWKEAFMDTDVYQRTAEWGTAGSGIGKKFWGLVTKASWILATSFIVVGLPLVFEMDRELNEDPNLAGGASPDAASGPKAS
ncbi:hypothetical protein FVE85_7527 [Porphyridium purpureum]|uniref:Uncharacterized protein n=1 Tax=Porphyridium purpureum TaxID=35688 RepID=A0A5J4ZA82_PORPP|nr:hypothetical protein FVE85_7527 [Porphyridium purpureum]|eukprot:POR5986..scf295_1